MKNYVITGSIGHISKPIIVNLVKAGKNVKVITTNQSKTSEIEALGAKALVGSSFDGAFLNKAFEGADVVYLMIPPIFQTNNWRASQDEMSNKYADAVRSNGVKYVVTLSSIGAHLPSGVGPVNGLHYLEGLLNNIPGLHAKYLRPGFFYYNFIAQIPMVKNAGIFGGNYGEGATIYLTDPADIAAAASEELLNLSFKNNSVRYVISDERSVNDIASVLGKAVGKDAPWVNFTDEDQQKGLLGAGLPETIANGYVEMGQSIRSGKMFEDMLRAKPAFGPTKLEDFAKQFKAAYNA